MVPEVIPANEHHCPVCGNEIIPIWRAMCGTCFFFVPWKLRAEFMHAYRGRVLDNRHYQEVLIEVRQLWLIADKARREAKEL
jgi:hypothetical protein